MKFRYPADIIRIISQDILKPSIKIINPYLDGTDELMQKSFKYNIYTSTLESTIAFKLKLPAEQLLEQINSIKNSLNNLYIQQIYSLFQDIFIDNNKLFFVLSEQTLIKLRNNIFTQVATNIYGRNISANNFEIDMKYQYNADNQYDLSFCRDTIYYHALVKLLTNYGYKVNFIRPIETIEYFDIITLIKKLLISTPNRLMFQDQTILVDNRFTEYAKYIFTYVAYGLKSNRMIFFCGDNYSIDPLKHINRTLNMSNVTLIESNPLLVLDKENLDEQKLSNNVNYSEYIDDMNVFKYACCSYTINNTFIFNPERSKNELLLFKQLYNDLYKVSQSAYFTYEINFNSFSKINEMPCEDHKDIVLLNYISQFNTMLDMVTTKLNLATCKNYLFRLYQLSRHLYASILELINSEDVKREQRIAIKLQLITMVRYIIDFIMDIFNINLATVQ